MDGAKRARSGKPRIRPSVEATPPAPLAYPTSCGEVFARRWRPARARRACHPTVACHALPARVASPDRTQLCGRRHEHDRNRQGARGGHTEAELPFGGRRIRVRRPRVRGSGGREVPLPTWRHFADADPLTPRAGEQMVLGVSTRNYERSLESTPSRIESRGASKERRQPPLRGRDTYSSPYALDSPPVGTEPIMAIQVSPQGRSGPHRGSGYRAGRSPAERLPRPYRGAYRDRPTLHRWCTSVHPSVSGLRSHRSERRDGSR